MDCKQFEEMLPKVQETGTFSDEELFSQFKQHALQCSRCRTLLETTNSPVVTDTDTGSSLANFDTTGTGHHRTDRKRTLSSFLSWAGSRAMSPQVATGALLLLLLSSSYLLFAGGRRNADGAPTISERGALESNAPQPSITQSITQPPPLPRPPTRATSTSQGGTSATTRIASPPSSLFSPHEQPPGHPSISPPVVHTDSGANSAEIEEFNSAISLFDAGRFAESRRAFDAIALKGGHLAPKASLFSALSIRASSGCDKALPFLEGVVNRFGQSPEGKQAKWETARCARVLGDYIRARILLRELIVDPNYKERASAELRRVGGGHRSVRQ